MLVDRRTDVCETALSLAGPTLVSLQAGSCPASDSQVIQNMYRVLLGYSMHGFQGIPELPEDDNLDALKRAFATAFSDSFPEDSVAVAVDCMKPVLKDVLHPNAANPPKPYLRDRTLRFFQKLVSALSEDPSSPGFQS